MSGLDDDWEILPRQTSKPKAPILTLESSEEESKQIEEEIRRQLMSRQEREAQAQIDQQTSQIDDKTVSREESTESAVSISLDTIPVFQQEQPFLPATELVQSEPSVSTIQPTAEQVQQQEDNTPHRESTIPTYISPTKDHLQSESTIRHMASRPEYDSRVDSLPPNTELKVIFGSLLAMAVHSIIFSPKAVEAF